MRTRKRSPFPEKCRRQRSGFTLVELMIVIAVIILLATITIAAFANFIMTSKEKATATTISKINKILQQRKEAFDRLNFKDAAKGVHAGYSPSIGLRASEVVVRKQRFELAFPQRVEERSLYNGLDYKSYFMGLSSRPNYESSALLYLAITDGETFGSPQVDDDAFTAAEVTSIPITIGGSTVDLKYFIDAWGQPLRFYRWPTGLIRPASGGTIDRSYSLLLAPSYPPAASASDPLNSDPDDPTQFFFAYYSGLTSTQQSKFQSDFNLYFSPSTFHTPLLVSAGPDRILGLFEPNDSNRMNSLANPMIPGPPTSTSPVQDNITNLNLRNKGN